MIKNNNFLAGLLIFLTGCTNALKCRDKNGTITTCDQIYSKVSECTSEFVSHAMRTSDPFTMCTDEFSVDSYLYTMDLFEKLFVMNDPSNATAFCSDQRLNKNKMNVIVNFVTQSRALWEAANCDQCYAEISLTNKTFSNCTNQFLELHTTVSNCMKDTAKLMNSSAVCIECIEDYQKLNILFDRASEASGDKICFDLVDKMNKTRREWSGVYKCCKDKRDSLTAFFSLAAAVILIAISFYFIVYFVGSKHPSSEIIDENDIARLGHSEQSNAEDSSPSTSGSSVNSARQLLINKDDSDDDMLTGENPIIAHQQNFIALAN